MGPIRFTVQLRADFISGIRATVTPFYLSLSGMKA